MKKKFLTEADLTPELLSALETMEDEEAAELAQEEAELKAIEVEETAFMAKRIPKKYRKKLPPELKAACLALAKEMGRLESTSH